MQTGVLVIASLLGLGLAQPLWAGPRPLPAELSREAEQPSLNQARQPPVIPVPVSRGQLLYEIHCTACHESVVHIRSGRKAKSLPELRAWAIKWSSYLQLHWEPGDVEEVVRDLNSRYYKFEYR